MSRKREHPQRRPVAITGASAGIGAATALALAEAGYPVALGARRTERCQELVDTIVAAGGEAVALPLDLLQPGSIEAFAAAATESLGDIEVLVSNAGRVAPGVSYQVLAEQFAEEVDLNLLAVQRLARAFVPAMVTRQRGDVLFVSSDVAVRARPFMSAYTASKWGLEGFVSALQMELEGTGVRAGVVRPGPTWSEMGSDWDAELGAVTLDAWTRFGLARHNHFLKPRAIADAVCTVVSAPRGVHINLVEVSPEAPVEDL